MATKIVTKNSSTSGSAPLASDLVQGELAVNVTDKRLYTENASGTIVEVGTNPSAEIIANGGIALPDNGKATFGAADDLEIYHDGSNSYVSDVGTGRLFLSSNGDGVNIVTNTGENLIRTDSADGRVRLYFDNEEKMRTNATGINVTGNVALGDNDKATFGAGDDLQIYHNGGSSLIEDAGSGGLYIRASDTLRLQAYGTNADMLRADSEGAVSLFYDKATYSAAKLATTSTGIDVTGTATMDGLTVSGDARVNGTSGKLTYVNDVAGWTVRMDAGDEDLHIKSGVGSPINRVTFADSGDISFYEDTGTTPKFHWSSSAESLGIGTSSPSQLLHLTSSGFAYARLNNSSFTGIDIGQHTGGNVYFNLRDNKDQIFQTNNTERFRIAADGSLSTSTAGTSNVRFGVNAGNSIVSGGNYNTVVGDEAGTAITTGANNTAHGYQSLYRNTTASNNTAVGHQSLYLNTTGGANVAVGKDALINNTTADNNTALGTNTLRQTATGSNNTAVGTSSQYASTGSENTSVGVNALRFNSTASNNVAVGMSALFANTSGGANTAVGKDALKSNTTASNNTAVGYQSQEATTTGASNTSVGLHALRLNTTGTENTAVGTEALATNTTGRENDASGRKTLFANTTGSYNSASGATALATNTTGANNTAHGYRALYLNTTASNNTAVGYQSLYANTTGINNNVIGSNAGATNTTGNFNNVLGESALRYNTTGSQNVAIGGSALRDNTTASNNVGIGESALRANTTGTENVAIGNNAGDAITTSSENTAVGASALSAAAGANNTAMGRMALRDCTGASNTAVGHQAGIAVNSGNNNTLLGKGTGDSITTGTGNTLIGKGADTTAVDSANTVVLGVNVQGATNYTTLGNGSNDIRAQHGVATWATVSDERYKKDIADSTTGLSFINALQPRTFNYKTLGELPETFSAYEEGSTEVFKSSQTQHGFIAQEIKAAIDADESIKDGFKLWDDREDGSQEVAEAALIPVLVKAVQELSTQLDAALARIETLEG